MSAVGIAEDYNIQEAWNKACQAFAQTTKVDLTTSPKLSIDEVLDEIRRRQDEDDEKHNKYRAAKDVISKTGNFIMVLGGIAAEGASMVFAPSSLCFNAISYLIQTGAKYKRIFSSLAELFGRISDVLERCKIYMRLPAEAVDISLRKIINEELVCFVEICTLSIKVMKGNKILTVLKVFAFDSDEGVSDQLSRLASLVERESQMRATLGFESQKISEKAIMETRDGAKKVTASVDKILTLETKRDADNMAKRLLTNIDDNLDMPSHAFRDVQAIYKRHLNEQIRNSGQWLHSDPLYTAWIDSPRSQCSILGIAGDEGSGKSFLFTAVVKALQEAYNEQGEDMTRTAVAYYIFNKDKKNPSLIKALEVLAWQIAQVDMVYRKDLGSVQTAGINKVDDLCDQLFRKSQKADSTFFLLLDDMDQVDKQHLKEFLQVLGNWQARSADWSRFTLRILLTGRTDIIGKIEAELGDGMTVIDMASKNRDDINIFIRDRMDKMDILSGPSEQVKTLRGEILESLTKQTKGDFVNVGLLLDEINGKQRPGEIREILSRSGENRFNTIERKIESLNETLSDEDISDLNDLLTWVIFSTDPISLEELEAVLFLKSGEPSLRPLAEKIRDQFSSLFHIAAAQVHLVSDSIGDFLLLSSVQDGRDDDQNLKDSGDVNEAEVKIVRRFLESVCDPELFHKFGFEEFFQRKLKGKAIRIGVDPGMANLTIASACLEVICATNSPNLYPLLPYAITFFGDYLERVDPALTLPRHKVALGPKLVKVFADDEIINRWWGMSIPRLRWSWIYNDEMSEVILKWLQDSAVTKNVPEAQRRWIKTLSSKSEPDADLLEHVGRALARKWLQPGLIVDDRVFDAVMGYITKIEHRKDPSVVRVTDDWRPSETHASQILHAAKWAQEQIGLEELGYEESRNVARTLREYSKHPEAIEQFKHTSTLTKENWLSQWGLAECYAVEGEFSTAIEIVEATIKGIQKAEIGNPEELKEELVEMNDDLASWHRNTGRKDIALAIYEERLRVDPYDYETTYKLITLLHEQAKYTTLLEFLQTLKSSPDTVSGLDLRTRNFHEHCRREPYHQSLFASVQSDREFDLIFESYDEAITAAKAQLTKERKAGNSLREWQAQVCQIELMGQIARLCQQHSVGRPDREQCAIDHWLRIIEVNATHDQYIVNKQMQAQSRFALLCFDRAIQSSPEAASEYLKQLKHLESIITLDKGETGGKSFDLDGSHPTRLLARYHALRGDYEKAKSALRPFLKLNLDMLSDDDPLNDWFAYMRLAIQFMCAGQDADALAAWSLIPPNTDHELVENGSVGADGHDHKVEGPMYFACDGYCGTIWTYADDMYICVVCNDVGFDQQCLNKLRDGTLKQDVCKKEHDMLHVPAYDPVEHKRIGEGNVKVGEDIMSVEDWLQRVRRDWGLELA